MAAFKKGDVVSLKSAVPTGPIVAMRMSEDGEVFYLVEWTDHDNEVQQRWFKEDQLTS